MDQKFDINKLQVASPCSVGWENMSGDERTRHCGLCSLNVYNVSELTATEVEHLIENREVRVCIRMYRRADGTVLTKDCPIGFRMYQKRLGRFAGATLSTVLSLFSFTFAQKEHVTPDAHSRVNVIKQNDYASKYNLRGVVVDLNGAVVPGAAILLYPENGKMPAKTVSDSEGNYGFGDLSEGLYRIEVPAASGFMKLIAEKVRVETGKSTEIILELSVDADVELIGVVAAPALIDMAITGPTPTRITREMLDRLPGRKPHE